MYNCKDCKVDKVRITSGRRGSGYLHKDEEGRRWNGKQCPDCRVEFNRKLRNGLIVAKRPRGITANPVAMGLSEVVYPPKLRACRNCKVMNVNYFECDSCRSVKAVNGCLDSDMYGLAVSPTYKGTQDRAF